MTVRIFLLVWLSLLQAFAPLLHAHWGREIAPSVLHLPGLERYYHLGDHIPEFDRSAPLQDLEGVIVHADEGVDDKPPKVPALAEVLAWSFALKRGILSPLSSHDPPPLRFCLNDLLPRAPPA